MLKLNQPLAPCAAARSIRKRVFDVCVATLALILAAPIMLLVYLLLLFDGGGPAIIAQPRTGLAGRDIHIFKFRTQNPACADIPGEDSNPLRETNRLGRFLRHTGIDQLPQLINVLAGDMSIVGPHPHPPNHEQYFAATIEGYTERFRAVPGMTGLAQIMALRGVIPPSGAVQQRVAYDIRYINDWSPLLDLEILAEALFSAVVMPARAH